MAAIGVVATVVAGAVAAAGVVVGLLSLPDINRYRRLRKM